MLFPCVIALGTLPPSVLNPLLRPHVVGMLRKPLPQLQNSLVEIYAGSIDRLRFVAHGSPSE